MYPEPDLSPDPHATCAILDLHQRAVRRACLPGWIVCSLPVRALTALLHIHTRGTVTIGWIKEACSLDGPTASGLIDQLVRQGLATRAEDTADRRRTVVRLTPAGTALISDLLSGAEARWREWFERLDHDELHALITGLHALTTCLAPVAGAIPGGCGAIAGPASAGRYGRPIALPPRTTGRGCVVEDILLGEH